jgi:hemerythrin superfamily protein
MDAITMLKEDHKSVEKLFKRFEKAGENAHAEKRAVVERIIEALSQHAAIEEQVFYPVTRATVPTVEDVALESLEEHHIVKWILSELDGMDPAEERYDAKVTVLIENVRHHVEEEEEEYFPKVREELGRKALAEIGDAMEQARKAAPTHPHPRSPDTPPGNIVVGTVAAAVDKAADTAIGAVQGGTEAAKDLVERVTGLRVKRSAAKGSPTTRKAARTTKRRASEAEGKAKASTKKAERVGKTTTAAAKRNASKTASTAKRGAKATAKSARSGARSTARSAKASASR